METVSNFFSEKLSTYVGEGWRWFAALNREEWMIVLAAAALLGFLCLRGYGSRSDY